MAAARACPRCGATLTVAFVPAAVDVPSERAPGPAAANRRQGAAAAAVLVPVLECRGGPQPGVGAGAGTGAGAGAVEPHHREPLESGEVLFRYTAANVSTSFAAHHNQDLKWMKDSVQVASD